MKKSITLLLATFLAYTSSGQGGATWNVCSPVTQCWKITIINNLQCDLDFWFDYTLTHPCGDIVAAWDNLAAPITNLVTRNTQKDLFAYQIDWPCEPNATICACPSHFKFRIGNPNIALSSPLALEPWPILSSFGTSRSITYVTSLLCLSNPISITVTYTSLGNAIIRYDY